MVCLFVYLSKEGVPQQFCRNREGSEYQKILAVNVVGKFLTTKAFLPLLRKRHTKRILQMSSGLGSISINRLGMTNPEKNPVGNRWIAYGASKAALNMRKPADFS